MNEVEIYSQKSRAGKVEKNKKDNCFQTNPHPSNITGQILGGDTEADAAMRKEEVSRRYFLYLESLSSHTGLAVTFQSIHLGNIRHHLLEEKSDLIIVTIKHLRGSVQGSLWLMRNHFWVA